MAARCGTLQRSLNWHRIAPELPGLGHPMAIRGGTLRRIPLLGVFVFGLGILVPETFLAGLIT